MSSAKRSALSDDWDIGILYYSSPSCHGNKMHFVGDAHLLNELCDWETVWIDSWPRWRLCIGGAGLFILWSVQFRFVCTSSLLHHAITATGNTKICCRDTDRWIQIWTLARSTSLKCEKHSTYQCATYQRTTFRAWLPPPNIHMRLINHVHTFYRGYILMWSSWIKTTKT